MELVQFSGDANELPDASHATLGELVTFEVDGELPSLIAEDALPPPKQSLEGERLERTRERERRKYYRKKERVVILQNQVKALEQQLKVLSQPASASESLTESEMSGGIQPDTQREKLEMLVKEIALTKVHLLKENTQLRQQFREASQRATLLYDLLSAEYKLYHVHESHFQLITPLSRKKQLEIHATAIRKMKLFQLMVAEEPVVGSVGGWEGRRFTDGGMFKFALEKTLSFLNADIAWKRLWNLMVNPSQLRRVYSSEMNMRARLIQKLDEDNYVFMEEVRSLDPADNGAPVRAAVLMSRFRVGNRYCVYTQNLDPLMIEMVDKVTRDPVEHPYELWSSDEQLVWIEFEDIGDGKFLERFCGVMPTIGAGLYYWMAEIVLIALRCENIIYGPRFSLPS